MSHARRILVAIDFTEQSDRALRTALSMGAAYGGTEIHAAYVKSGIEGMPMSGKDVKAMDADLEKAAAHVAKIAADYRALHPDADIPEPIPHRLFGAPAGAILRHASGLQVGLIVVGTRDRRGFARVLLGSVAAAIVEKATCPVLVVRPIDHSAADAIPDIEPLCEQCSTVRAESKGAELWCERHKEHHLRISGYSYQGASNAPVRPWGF